MKKVLDAAPDPVVVVDPGERRILWASRRAAVLFGRAPESLEDAPVAELLDGRAGERLWDLLSGSEEGGVVCLEFPGGPVWLQVSRADIGFRGRQALLVALRDVTAVAEQARQARDTARILETVLEHSDNGLVLLGPDHRIRYYNQRARELWGVPEDVLWPGPTLEDMVRWVCNEGIYPPDEVEELVRQRMRQMEEARQGKRVEYLAPRRDGRVVEAVAVGLPDGGVLVPYRDVTAQERVLAELREQEERFRGMLEALPDPVYIRGPEGVVEYANPAMVSRCGRDPRGEPCYAAVHGLTAPCSWCRDPGPEPWTGEWRSPRDGRYYRVTLARLAGGDGSRRMGILRDVTVERTSEDRLRAEKEFAESLVASLAVGAFVLDADGSIRVWNRAAELLTGVPASRMVGTRDAWFPFYAHPRPTLADLVLRGRSSEAGRYYENWGPSPLSPDGLRAEGWFDDMNGRRRFLVFEAVPIRDGRGRIRAVLETVQDLTDLKEAQAGRARLDAAVDQAAEGIAVVDRRGRIRHANPAFRRIVGNGTRVSELIGEVPGPEESPRRFRRSLAAANGAAPRELDLSVTPLRGGDGSAVVVARDVTQEVLLERQVRQAQKLESLGTLASGIAHDFNNILTAVTGYLELAMDEVHSPQARQNLDRVLAAVDRAAALVARMLAFGREAEGDPRPVRLCWVLDEALDLLRSGLGPEVELVCRWAVRDDRVVVDPVQVQQVVVNLVTNAAQALGDEGGRVEVSVRDAEVDEALARGRPGLVPGAYLRITVSDNGCGIPAEVLPRIFDPFFTTKEVGQGTGLGLAMVHGIVASWGGAVEVHSEPGQGTTFHVFVPRQGPGATDGTPGPCGSGERILVVDDDPSVAEILAEVLTSKGYRPEVFGHPAEAIEAIEADPAGFHAVVTDQAMPGMDGIEFLERVRRIRPELPAVVCTGFEREETRRAAERLGGVQVMLKPFTAGELARALAAALGPRQGEQPAPAATRTGGEG
ncbi:MAG: PAS domain-containing protein [Deltaproteobacteria bacterium]|nr:PAS domain-containing protein [Deltaproteobacteria bacterium]